MRNDVDHILLDDLVFEMGEFFVYDIHCLTDFILNF